MNNDSIQNFRSALGRLEVYLEQVVGLHGLELHTFTLYDSGYAAGLSDEDGQEYTYYMEGLTIRQLKCTELEIKSRSWSEA